MGKMGRGVSGLPGAPCPDSGSWKQTCPCVRAALWKRERNRDLKRHLSLPTVIASSLLCFSACHHQDGANNKGAVGTPYPVVVKTIDHLEVQYRPQPPLDAPGSNFPGFKPGETVLHKGYKYQPGRLALKQDMIFDRDVAIKMRDGVTLYADVYRPVGKGKVPAIICYGADGKGSHTTQPTSAWPDAAAAATAATAAENARTKQEIRFIPVGSIASKITSGLEPHLALDPAQWVPEGYAIVNVDERGVFMSGGDLDFFGPQMARDGYDVVEFIAQQDWSSGKVALAGAMWDAMTQWTIAAERPPHLAAIAPWDAGDNIYRDEFVRDGIQREASTVTPKAPSTGLVEDMGAMAYKYPLMNAYWESKIADLGKIDIPTYLEVSYTTQHTRGGIEAFNQIATNDKWLWVRNSQEYTDMYEPKVRADMKRFFDRYLKGKENGWEKTPRVRLAVIDPGGSDIVDRAENEMPLARELPRALYLDAESGGLDPAPAQKESKVSYQADDGKGKAVFTIPFDKETEITGFIKLRLWVEVDGANDMDLFAMVSKLDASGKPLTQENSEHPYWESDGRLRASERRLDEKASTPLQPVHTHRVIEPIKAGEIVPVEIQIWPMGMIFHPGQQLQLSIAGYDLSAPGRGHDRPIPHAQNKGNHILHTGGKYDSYLLVPVIPPKVSHAIAAAAGK